MDRITFQGAGKPYKEQTSFMAQLYCALSYYQLGVFHSPTGTGKTLSFVWSCILWALDNKKERISLCTQTHLQCTQIIYTVKEQFPELTTVTLGSRERLCAHPLRNQQANLAKFCKKMREKGTCEPYQNRLEAMKFALRNVVDIEDLANFGQTCESCSYYGAIEAAKKARVVVAPYQIMLGTKRFNVSAVIFDEAHNLPEIIRQEGTSLLNFAKVLRKLSAHRKVTQSESIFFQKILGFVMENMENEALLWPSKLIKTGYLNNLTKFEENYCKLPFSRQNKCVLRLFGQLKRMKKKPMSYAIVRKERVLSLVLVDPREKFKKLVENTKCIFVSGVNCSEIDFLVSTQSPESVHRYNCKPFFPSNNFKLFNFRTFDGQALVLTYPHKNDSWALSRIAKIIELTCCAVPGGVICFFTSYDHSLAFQRYITSNIFDVGKIIHFEKQGESSRILKTYKENASSGQGAILFAVIGGSFDQGLDFKDCGNCVIIVGMPYLNPQDPYNIAIGSFYKRFQPPHQYPKEKCQIKVLQCLGRSIRSPTQIGAGVLIDERYGELTLPNYTAIPANEDTFSEISLHYASAQTIKH